jgi:hypothetical protein
MMKYSLLIGGASEDTREREPIREGTNLYRKGIG